MSDGDDVQRPATARPPAEGSASPAIEPSPDRDPPRPRPPLRQRLSELFAEYGRIAIVTYFTLSILTIIGFSVAIGISAEPESATGVIGVIFAGWAAAKATLPIRIVITLAVTPMVAFVVTRRGRRAARGGVPSADEGTDAVPAADPPVGDPQPEPVLHQARVLPADGRDPVQDRGDAARQGAEGKDPVHRAR